MDKAAVKKKLATKLKPVPTPAGKWRRRILRHDEVAPEQLLANPMNHRVHSMLQQNLTTTSLDELGWLEEVMVNEGTGNVVDGHMRIMLAMREGEPTVPVKFVDMTEAEELAALRSFDSITAMAGMDRERIVELEERAASLNENPRIAEMLTRLREMNTPQADLSGKEKSAPPVVATDGAVFSSAGKVYELGPHRIVCGDCRDPEVVAGILGGKNINVAVTSPPYAAQREYDDTSGFNPIAPADYVEWFAPVAANLALSLADDGSWFLNIKEHCDDGQRVLYVKDLTIAHVREWGWKFVDEFIWTHGGTPKAVVKRFKNGWEPVFQFTRTASHKFRPDAVMHASSSVPDWKGKHPSKEGIQGTGSLDDASKRKYTQGVAGSGNTYGDRVQGTGNVGGGWSADDGMAYPSNVLSLGKNRESLGHSAAYPVGLPEFFAKAYSDEGDVVFDPFMGSGSTLIAAANTGRVAYGCEISAAYVDVIRRRWTRYAKDNDMEPGSGALEG